MNINFNNKKKTEEELDIEALEKDIVLFDYLERVEKDQLTPKEKKEREEFYKTIGFDSKKK